LSCPSASPGGDPTGSGFAAGGGSVADVTVGPELLVGGGCAAGGFGFGVAWDCRGAAPARLVGAEALASVEPLAAGAGVTACGAATVARGGEATRCLEEEARAAACGGGTMIFAAGGGVGEPGAPGAPAACGGRLTEPESRSTAIAAAPSRTATAAAATTPDLVTAENALPVRGSLADTGLLPPSFLRLRGGI
jgi:hypothetical protein